MVGVGTGGRMVTYSLFRGSFRVEATCVDGRTYRSKPQRGGGRQAEALCGRLSGVDRSDPFLGWALA
jgi:hypothetical protein